MEAGQTDAGFGKQLRKARDAKGWSQTELAKRLGERGIDVYGSTIAKIETGVRPAKLTELVALADLFEVSVDTLLGRDRRPQRDRLFMLRAVGDAAYRGSGQIVEAASAIRDRITDLSAFDDLPSRDAMAAGFERAHELLVEANEALTDVAQAARRDLLDEVTAK